MTGGSKGADRSRSMSGKRKDVHERALGLGSLPLDVLRTEVALDDLRRELQTFVFVPDFRLLGVDSGEFAAY